MDIGKCIRWIHPFAKETIAFHIDQNGNKIYMDNRYAIENTIKNITKMFDDMCVSGHIFVMDKPTYNTNRRVFLTSDIKERKNPFHRYKLFDDPLISRMITTLVIDNVSLISVKSKIIDSIESKIAIPFNYNFEEPEDETSDSYYDLVVKNHRDALIHNNYSFLNTLFADCEDSSKAKTIQHTASRILHQYFNKHVTVHTSYTSKTGVKVTVTFVNL